MQRPFLRGLLGTPLQLSTTEGNSYYVGTKMDAFVFDTLNSWYQEDAGVNSVSTLCLHLTHPFTCMPNFALSACFCDLRHLKLCELPRPGSASGYQHRQWPCQQRQPGRCFLVII